MNEVVPTHHWVRGGLVRDREAAMGRLGLPAGPVMVVNAHRGLRGPYTAAGTLVRAMVPDVLLRDRKLVERYDIELLSAAPDLRSVVPNSRETLTSMALPAERTRYYARLRTTRISNGLVEFVRDGLAADGPRVLVVENADRAEATDLEFLTALVRRIDPAHLTVVVRSGGTGPADEALLAVLAARAQVTEVHPSAAADGPADAWAYVASDCTTDEPAPLAAYEALDPAARALLHDRRAAELAERDEESLRLGAIAHHLEHGSDPGGAGVPAVFHAMDHSLCNGFYEACVDYGRRGLALVDPRTEHDRWWAFTKGVTLSLSILGRTYEAEKLDDQARLNSVKPAVHMAAAYNTAMLYTRHNDPEDRDEFKAKAWLNSAIATASLIENRGDRAFQSAFYKNGLALVEVNLGEPTEALRLVDEAISSLDELLGPDEHVLHRSVLKNNRARVYLSLGRIQEALADYAIVIREDPNHAEHYLERGNILRRLGRPEEAFEDYARAMRLSPPFPEIYYNRGDLRLNEGDTEGALADFSYVIELVPEFVDAYVNRAGLLLEAGELDAAEQDANTGLGHEPDNPYLHAVLGQVHAEREEFEESRAAFDRALAADPDMITALSGRAALAYDMGELDTAALDLGHAVELQPDDPALRYNRAFVHQDTGHWEEALADLEIAAGLAPDDSDITEALDTCRRKAAAAR
ncbi:tetratricopeptide repeat protein [Streptomyces sp. RKAG337]|uniref:tetratricopeptide repeat protein n=1 Tax=Streptomyces sp. RKAG337 TaxID=2893404 RepID=UPI0020342513|nr:tetratricopeptide repeat protein [Streptomyces sp. RKAG337]MCM2424660.1 tetratricopeptide repeat protein [Streptomyces sp. RKAG337]